MLASLSPSRRRLLAILLLAVPLAVGMGFVYLPLNAIASRRAQLEWLDQQILGLRERSQERARLLETSVERVLLEEAQQLLGAVEVALVVHPEQPPTLARVIEARLDALDIQRIGERPRRRLVLESRELTSTTTSN